MKIDFISQENVYIFDSYIDQFHPGKCSSLIFKFKKKKRKLQQKRFHFLFLKFYYDYHSVE